MVSDFPTGAARVIWEQQGYMATIVNGEVLLDDGTYTGALSGQVLRFNQ
jgi:N-acyl-D-aspartate/D-glutamate deacylase